MSTSPEDKYAIDVLKQIIDAAISEMETIEGTPLTWPTQQVLRGHIARAFEEGRLLIGEPLSKERHARETIPVVGSPADEPNGETDLLPVERGTPGPPDGER